MTKTHNIKQIAIHTSEPWWMDDDGFIAAGSGDTYCTVADPHRRPTADFGDENEANGCRIVAAVNACEGIPIESLEQGIVDELLAALQWLLDDLTDADKNCNLLTGQEYDTIANARAVLAKMTAQRRSV